MSLPASGASDTPQRSRTDILDLMRAMSLKGYQLRCKNTLLSRHSKADLMIDGSNRSTSGDSAH